MFGKALVLLSAIGLAATAPAAATSKEAAEQDSVAQGASETGGQSYGDRNRGGPYGFYSYPRHFHIDRDGVAGRAPSSTSAGTSAHYDRYHGSAYYGRDYGAPYFGGGYYDEGVYYRERRD